MHVISLTSQRRAVIIAGTMLGLFVAAMDQTVVSTALPRVVGDLGGLSLFAWVFTSYMLTSTTVVPLAGRLSDMYGRKPFFVTGIAVFMLTSVFAGASQSMLQLIVSRGFQGLGAGMIMANAFAIIGDLFPPAERGRYMGLFSAVFGLASVTGPFLGGWLTDNLSWRWVFYVNIPVGIVALGVLIVGFPWIRPHARSRQIDYLGAATLVLAVVPLLLALVWGGDLYPWLSPQIAALLAMSALGVGFFVLAEARAAEPILPLGLFRNRTFAVTSVVGFLVGMGMFGAISYMPLFMQGVLGVSATNSGAVTMPLSLGLVVSSAITGQIVTRTGRYRLLIILGSMVLALGMFLMSRMNQNTAQVSAVRNMVVVGVGVGLSMPILGLAVQNALPYRLLGVATASSQFFRQIGGTLGIAIFGTLITKYVSANLQSELPMDVRSSAPPAILKALEDPQILLSPSALDRLREGFAALGSDGPRLFTESVTAMQGVLSDGLGRVFFAGLVVAVVALVFSVLLPEVPLRTTILDQAESDEMLGASPPSRPAMKAPPAPATTDSGADRRSAATAGSDGDTESL